MEVWKRIDGTEFYEVSNYGRVRSNNYLGHGTTKVLALAKDQKGYLRVRIYFGKQRITCKVHRLVARAFIPNPSCLPQVNHVDGNKENNHVENLEWCSAHDNVSHAYASGLKEKNREFARKLGMTYGKEALRRYCDKRKIPVIATNISTGDVYEFESTTKAAQVLGIHQPNIWKVLNGKRKSSGGFTFMKRR